LNGGSEGEESSKGANVSGGFSANRTTDNLKIEIGTRINYNQSAFKLEDDTAFKSVRRSMNVNGLLARSHTATSDLRRVIPNGQGKRETKGRRATSPQQAAANRILQGVL
jgi:hypothetical protein